MPADTIYVGRGSRWGNPLQVGFDVRTPFEAKFEFEVILKNRLHFYPHYLDRLRGKNLACWCPLDQPCHADVLLKLANK